MYILKYICVYIYTLYMILPLYYYFFNIMCERSPLVNRQNSTSIF